MSSEGRKAVVELGDDGVVLVVLGLPVEEALVTVEGDQANGYGLLLERGHEGRHRCLEVGDASLEAGRYQRGGEIFFRPVGGLDLWRTRRKVNRAGWPDDDRAFGGDPLLLQVVLVAGVEPLGSGQLHLLSPEGSRLRLGLAAPLHVSVHRRV